jgi:hypothetical protein
MCYSRLQIEKLENVGPPVDIYLKSLVTKEDSIYVDALNLYSTLFPKSLSLDLFGMFLASLEDKEMDEVFINSMIIAARSIWFFGKSGLRQEKLDSYKIRTLHIFGNNIGISIIGHIVENYRDLDLDLEDETNLSRLYGEIDLTMINILDNIRDHDDGTLGDYITETIHIIQTSEIFS